MYRLPSAKSFLFVLRFGVITRAESGDVQEMQGIPDNGGLITFEDELAFNEGGGAGGAVCGIIACGAE